MEKKVSIIYSEFNETFGAWNMSYEIKVKESDAAALKEILKNNGYGFPFEG